MENPMAYRSPIYFDFDVACKYGLDVSVFVSELNRTILWHADAKTWGSDAPDEERILPTIVVNGLTYAPFTLADLEKVFPWWSNKQIRLIKKNSLDAGLISQDCFNSNPWDRTMWYAVKFKSP